MDVAEFRTEPLLTIGDAARLLGLSTSRVRQLADGGALPVIKTASGVRLFHQRDVERLTAQRLAEVPARTARLCPAESGSEQGADSAPMEIGTW